MSSRSAAPATPVISFLVAVVIVVAAVAVISLSPHSGTSTITSSTLASSSTTSATGFSVSTSTSSSSTTAATTTNSSSMAVNSASSASADGLILNLSLNATGIQSGQSISITVDEENSLPQANNVSVSKDWPLSQGTLAVGPCGTFSYPMGWAIAQGYISANNESAAKWIDIYEPGAYPCPLVLAGITSYNFQPSSNVAVISQADCSLSSCGGQGEPMSATSSFSGYWSGSTFSDFAPGVYTVVAGDEWATLVFVHFTVEASGAG